MSGWDQDPMTTTLEPAAAIQQAKAAKLAADPQPSDAPGSTPRDNLVRGLRTAGQGIMGFLAAGGLDVLWKEFLSTHGQGLDPFVLILIGLVLTGVASWAHNMIEDKTGRAIGPVPRDRALGDATLGQGLGSLPTK